MGNTCCAKRDKEEVSIQKAPIKTKKVKVHQLPSLEMVESPRIQKGHYSQQDEKIFDHFKSAITSMVDEKADGPYENDFGEKLTVTILAYVQTLSESIQHEC